MDSGSSANKSSDIILSGEPKSTQTIYRAACQGRFPRTYMTPEGKALKEQYQWEAKSQWRRARLEGDVSVSITFFFATKRRRDLDNQNKLVLDALSGVAYRDDAQIAELRLRRAYDAKQPRIEINVAAIQTLRAA